MIPHFRPLIEQVKRFLHGAGERQALDRESFLSDEFPVVAVGNVIVGRGGKLIATLPTPAMADDLVQRLNEGEWHRQEELWAL
ncbi:hypothetical protein [Bradyrhizobium genosp. A]|uniref:hypothetical protein n=1 Tax=Bradyrhizobium genosp. A TaxID=83626 RepID=UPI003CEC9865